MQPTGITLAQDLQNIEDERRNRFAQALAPILQHTQELQQVKRYDELAQQQRTLEQQLRDKQRAEAEQGVRDWAATNQIDLNELYPGGDLSGVDTNVAMQSISLNASRKTEQKLAEAVQGFTWDPNKTREQNVTTSDLQRAINEETRNLQNNLRIQFGMLPGAITRINAAQGQDALLELGAQLGKQKQDMEDARVNARELKRLRASAVENGVSPTDAASAKTELELATLVYNAQQESAKRLAQGKTINELQDYLTGPEGVQRLAEQATIQQRLSETFEMRGKKLYALRNGKWRKANEAEQLLYRNLQSRDSAISTTNATIRRQLEQLQGNPVLTMPDGRSMTLDDAVAEYMAGSEYPKLKTLLEQQNPGITADEVRKAVRERIMRQNGAAQ